MKKTIIIAGIPIAIETIYESMTAAFDEYETDRKPSFTVTTTEADIDAEERKSISECAYEGIPYPGFSRAELENTAIYRKIAAKLPEYDALVFHGSAVAVGEEAVLFTACSGTGKTTHTRLWLKNIPGSYVVNGDKPVLRVTEGNVLVCGTPWMGKECLGCAKDVTLKALCFLNRGAENRIEKTTLSAVLPRLIGQAYRPADRALISQTVRLLDRIGRNVGLYELFCNMEDEAARVSYEGTCL
ncbi:MAG: hypothetical protein MJ070_08105 [Lachnospiraceae bacterium]|nr:hypothetical protein [Lachnospiraceae bacterium]